MTMSPVVASLLLLLLYCLMRPICIVKARPASRPQIIQAGNLAGRQYRNGGGRHLMQTSSSMGPVLHMLYVHSDNNLDGMALLDVAEMYRGFASWHGNLTEYAMIVLIDRCKFSEHERECDPNPFPAPIKRLSGGAYVDMDTSFSTARLLQLRGAFWEQLDSWGEVDMDDPGTLTRFMNACFQKVPEPGTTILQLWDHGGGYQGFGGDYSNGQIGMGVSVMKDAIASSLFTNGVAKLDLLGFDACLMASFTVLEILHPVTRWLLASEDSEPGTGWDYTAVSSAAQNVQVWARTMINAFVVHPAPDPWQGPRVLALLDMALYGQYQLNLITLMDTITQKTSLGDELFMKAVSAARARSSSISVTQGAQNGMHIIFPEYSSRYLAKSWFDLYDLYDWEALPGLRAWSNFLHAHYDTTLRPKRGPECPPLNPYIHPADNTTLNATFYIVNPATRVFPGINVTGTAPDTAVSSYVYFGFTLVNDPAYFYWAGQSPGRVSPSPYATKSVVWGYWDGYISYLVQDRAPLDPRPADPENPTRYFCTPYFTQELSDSDGDGVLDTEKQTIPLRYFPPSSNLTNADLRSGTFDPFRAEDSFPATLHVTINSTTDKFYWKLFASTATGTVSEISKSMGGKIVPLLYSSKAVDIDEFEMSWCSSYFVWGEPNSTSQSVGEMDIWFQPLLDEETIADFMLESIVVDFDVQPVRGAVASVQAITEVDSGGGLSKPKLVCQKQDLCFSGLVMNGAPAGMGGKSGVLVMAFLVFLVASVVL
eukprot:jgi/Mesvir1/27965/Mv20171-RA.1